MKVLDAVSLEERFRTALPMLTRQIEGLKLLRKSKKWGPDSEKVVSHFYPPTGFNWAANGGSLLFAPRCYRCVKVASSQARTLPSTGKTKTKIATTLRSWRGKSVRPTCPTLLLKFASRS